MSRTSLAILMAATALAAGCASQLRVTYHSDPPAATLYRNGQPLGVTPVTVGYAHDPAFAQGRCVRIDGASVRWASGATASVPASEACPAQGLSRTYTFVRPDVPGRDVDLRHAREHQHDAILDRRARAGQDAITAQIMNTLDPPRAPPAACTGTPVGHVERTDCR